MNPISPLPGVGGQIDFIRGAALGSDGLGKPIIALPSVTKTGESKIVPYVKKGNQKICTIHGHPQGEGSKRRRSPP